MRLYPKRFSVGSIPQIKGVGVFDPTSIAGCSLWLSADKMGLSDGASVTSFTDYSGNARHLAGGGSATYKVNIINGKPVVRFTTASGLYTNYNFGKPFTVLYVAKQNDTGTGRILQGYANNWLLGWWNNILDNAYFTGWISTQQTSPAKDTNPRLYVATMDSGIVAYMYSKLTQLWTTSITGGSGPNGLTINASSSGEATNCDVAEVIVYNSVLSSADRTTVTNYLASKYNL